MGRHLSLNNSPSQRKLGLTVLGTIYAATMALLVPYGDSACSAADGHQVPLNGTAGTIIESHALAGVVARHEQAAEDEDAVVTRYSEFFAARARALRKLGLVCVARPAAADGEMVRTANQFLSVANNMFAAGKLGPDPDSPSATDYVLISAATVESAAFHGNWSGIAHSTDGKLETAVQLQITLCGPLGSFGVTLAPPSQLAYERTCATAELVVHDRGQDTDALSAEFALPNARNDFFNAKKIRLSFNGTTLQCAWHTSSTTLGKDQIVARADLHVMD